MTRGDRIRNEYVRGSVGIASIVDNMRQNRLEAVRTIGCDMRRTADVCVDDVGGLGYWWPTPNSWDKGEGEEEDSFLVSYHRQKMPLWLRNVIQRL